MNLRKSTTVLKEDTEKETKYINNSKKICFKELLQKIDLENK